MKQHSIPRSYLRAWCDLKSLSNPDPYVWRFPKEGRIGQKKTPKNIFVETDMYTIKLNDGRHDLSIENGLAGLEGKFAKIRNDKIESVKQPTLEERVIICAFMAVMHCRTKLQRDHLREQWGQVLNYADDLKLVMQSATPEERERIAKKRRIVIDGDGPTLSYTSLKQLAQHPLQHMLIPMSQEETKIYIKMKMAILCAPLNAFFITSDAPCVWFDPEAYKRQPAFQHPQLEYPSIEITMPLSPSKLVFLSWSNFEGYANIDQVGLVDEFNRRTRYHCYEYFVSNSGMGKDIWYDPGQSLEK